MFLRARTFVNAILVVTPVLLADVAWAGSLTRLDLQARARGRGARDGDRLAAVVRGRSREHEREGLAAVDRKRDPHRGCVDGRGLAAGDVPRHRLEPAGCPGDGAVRRGYLEQGRSGAVVCFKSCGRDRGHQTQGHSSKRHASEPHQFLPVRRKRPAPRRVHHLATMREALIPEAGPRRKWCCGR